MSGLLALWLVSLPRSNAPARGIESRGWQIGQLAELRSTRADRRSENKPSLTVNLLSM